ncbi:MAG: gliding motility-associated protein GldE [Bacteroidales bacterium]|nr:gliding motility-associated protein GldE [Bacteroidales bacterium]
MDPDPLSQLSHLLQINNPVAYKLFFIILLLLLILINALISAFESTFKRINTDEAEELHTSQQPSKIRLSRLLRKPERVLSSVSLANHLLNLIIILLIIAQPWNNERLAVISGDMLFIRSAISFAVIIIFIYFLPRKTAIHHPLRFSEKNVNLIRWIDLLMAPLSGMLVRANTALIPSRAQNRHDISVDELSKALGITSDEARGEQEKELLEGIIRFRDKMVGDIFVSRTNMVALDILTPFREVIRFIVDAGYSRIPVYVENADTIKGILYVKDLLPHLDKTGNFKWQSLIRPAYFVPTTKRIDDLLEEFRSQKNHMAIVVDEYGGTAGLVTMEDILEEIVGDISDEYDEEQPFFTMTSDGSYLFEGKTPLEEFIRLTNLPEKDFESMQEQADTLAGLLLELKGDFPKRKESITYRDHHFVAEEMSKKRITKVRYIPPGKLMKD